MTEPRVNVYLSIPNLETATARKLSKLIRTGVRDRGVALVVLSGGDTPRGVYRRLGTLPEHIEWDRVHILFADERMVPPDDPASNYGMVRRELLVHVPIPASNVLRIRGEANPDVAAREYQQALQKLFRTTSDRADVVLLGIGDDGHTASLFPGTDVLHEHKEAVREVYVPRLDAWRVTLTLNVINKAREVLFLASGKQKAAVVRQVLGTAVPGDEFPATLVQPSPGTMEWFLDREAASELHGDYLLDHNPEGERRE